MKAGIARVRLAQPVLSYSSTDIAQAIETYFARALGLSLVLIATILLFFTGTVPLSSSIAEPVSAEDHDPKAPYAVPILYVTTIYHALSTIITYTRWYNYGSTPFLLGAIGYGGLACLGGWCIMFGTGSGRLSKRTGADKRAKGFPFTNTNAYNKKVDRKTG